VGHIGKTSKKVTKVVRYDAPNVVRHGGVSGFSEEFNIVPLGPHRTRVLLRQRFPKGPILSTLLRVPGTAPVLQYLVRNWNYQIGLEDYCVMQGQAHNIDDFGAPNWRATSSGDDLIVRFWRWVAAAREADGATSEYFVRWDGSRVDEAAAAAAAQPLSAAAAPSHADASLTTEEEMSSLAERYTAAVPVAQYPPINHALYSRQQTLANLFERVGDAMPQVGVASAVGAAGGLVTAAGAATHANSEGMSSLLVAAADLANGVFTLPA